MENNRHDSRVIIREATKKGYAEAFEGDSINLEQPNSKTRRGRVGRQVAQTLTTSPQQAVVIADERHAAAVRGECDSKGKVQQQIEFSNRETSNLITEAQKDSLMQESKTCRIRKLTPKECWRLMGFDDEDFDKAEQVCSNTQLYKQAGNSIVVDVLISLLEDVAPYFSKIN